MSAASASASASAASGAVPKLLTASYINNQFGTPADLKTVVSKNAGWERVEGTIRICTKLERLDLDSNSLSSITPVFDLPQLATLSVAHNKITDLTGIYRLGLIKSLNVAHNQLTNLDALTACTELRVLIANNNHLTKLPFPLPKNLAALIVSHNELTSLDGIENCTQLTKLSASHNSLTSLPNGLLNLTKLSELRLNHNSLSSLVGTGGEFGIKCGRIKLLDLGNNRFTELDPILDALLPMNFLRNLNLKGCPIEKRGEPLIEDPTAMPQGPNAHFLHTSALAAASAAAAAAAASGAATDAATSSTSISVSPSTINPSNSVSAPTHPPAYFLAIRKAMPLLAILDTKKLSEHEIQFRTIAEGATGKKGDKKNIKLTTDKRGNVIEKVKGMVKNQGARVPLPTLDEVAQGVTMQMKKSQKKKQQNKRTVGPNASAAAAASASSSSSGSFSGVDGFISLNSSSPVVTPVSTKGLTLPTDLQLKNQQRKLNRREKKQQELLKLQLTSGGAGAEAARKMVKEEKAKKAAERAAAAAEKKKLAKKSPLTHGLPPASPNKTVGLTSPHVTGAKRKRDAGDASASASSSGNAKQPPAKKAKPFSTITKKEATLATFKQHTPQQQQQHHHHQPPQPTTPKKGVAPSHSPVSSPSAPAAAGIRLPKTPRHNHPPGQLPTTPSAPQAQKKTQAKASPKAPKHQPSEPTATAIASDAQPPPKKAKTSANSSAPRDDSVVSVVRSGSSSFSLDALNSTFSRADHVGEAANSGW